MIKRTFACGLLAAAIAAPVSSVAAPRVVVISLDGGTPSLPGQSKASLAVRVRAGTTRRAGNFAVKRLPVPGVLSISRVA